MQKLLLHVTRRAVTVGVLACYFGQAYAAATDGARDFIRSLGDQTIRLLNDAGDDVAARLRAISGLLDRSVDLALIARLCLGRHWRSATETQRTEYVTLVRAYVLAQLANRMSYTGGERFQVTSAAPFGDDVVVESEIVYDSNDPPLSIAWRVRHNEGKYMIIDVVPLGVSLVETHRSEFKEVIENKGLDGLLADLRARLQTT